MSRKVSEYFRAGTRYVWLTDTQRRTVRVYRTPEDVTELSGEDVVSAEDILPGYRVAVSEPFRLAGIS
jgi:Uma2 family endonuclease